MGKLVTILENYNEENMKNTALQTQSITKTCNKILNTATSKFHRTANKTITSLTTTKFRLLATSFLPQFDELSDNSDGNTSGLQYHQHLQLTPFLL